MRRAGLVMVVGTAFRDKRPGEGGTFPPYRRALSSDSIE
jgi:hypothetical protein